MKEEKKERKYRDRVSSDMLNESLLEIYGTDVPAFSVKDELRGRCSNCNK